MANLSAPEFISHLLLSLRDLGLVKENVQILDCVLFPSHLLNSFLILPLQRAATSLSDGGPVIGD